ncbi:Arm DNA-binding domain-containing protein [Kosakonia radicincitans]|uniref:Arm DNA-binding domain-containing protein n=1 Tax=Kosakonia radicincitans TaxID=283686 RepID=UPI002F969CA7
MLRRQEVLIPIRAWGYQSGGSASGAVSFVFFFRHSGRRSAPVWMTLGKYPDMTLKQAREKRDECRAWLS